jgi:hypothetical protein
LFFEIIDFFLINVSCKKYNTTTIILLIKALIIISPFRKYRFPKKEAMRVNMTARPCKIVFISEV